MSRRIGVFELTRHMIENAPHEVVEAFYQLDIIPVRAEMLYHKDAIEYTAISSAFREVPDELIPPRYLIINSDGVYRVEEMAY